MRKKILTAIYSLVKDYSDSPFSVQLIADETKLQEDAVSEVFKELKNEELIKRKYIWTGVYRVTDKGLAAAKKASTTSEDFI
jgi:Mn-dependent DtxR family transcriptional regulator